MHFKATEPARQPTFATEKNDRKREGGTAGRNRRRKAAIKGEDGKKGCLPAAGAKKEGRAGGPSWERRIYFFLPFLFGFSGRRIGENRPLKQTVVAKVRACVALHNPAPGSVAPL